MAALLRHGSARRLGGSMVKRTQDEGRHQLGPRLRHTYEQAHGGIVLEIQQKKDELYDLIAKGENNFKTNSWDDAWLLQDLWKEVTPRPYDPDWCALRNVIGGLKRAGKISLAFLAANYYIQYSDDKEAKEEHEAARQVDTRSLVMEN